MIITGGYRLLRDRGGMPMIIRRNYHRRDRIKRAGASSARNWSARSDRKKKKKGGEGGGRGQGKESRKNSGAYNDDANRSTLSR